MPSDEPIISGEGVYSVDSYLADESREVPSDSHGVAEESSSVASDGPPYEV